MPALVKARLAHVRFESIHPFLDGNGRVERLLVAVMLHDAGVLPQPLLYLSLYLKQHRAEYCQRLDAVRLEGDWEAWLDFFLEGVAQTASGAVDTTHRLLALFHEDARRIQQLSRGAASVPRVFGALRARPVATLNDVARRSGVSFPTAAMPFDISPGACRGLRKDPRGQTKRPPRKDCSSDFRR